MISESYSVMISRSVSLCASSSPMVIYTCENGLGGPFLYLIQKLHAASSLVQRTQGVGFETEAGVDCGVFMCSFHHCAQNR